MSVQKLSVLLSTRSCKQVEPLQEPENSTAESSTGWYSTAQYITEKVSLNTSAQYNPGHHKTAQ